MQNKTYQAAPANNSQKVSQGTPANLLNLRALIATMKLSKSWANGELNAIIILNSPDQKIVLTMIHKDTEILSYQGGYSTTFQVIEGGLTFLNHNGSAFIDKGFLLTNYDNLAYKLSNAIETIFLLTTDNRVN